MIIFLCHKFDSKSTLIFHDQKEHLNKTISKLDGMKIQLRIISFSNKVFLKIKSLKKKICIKLHSYA